MSRLPRLFALVGSARAGLALARLAPSAEVALVLRMPGQPLAAQLAELGALSAGRGAAALGWQVGAWPEDPDLAGERAATLAVDWLVFPERLATELAWRPPTCRALRSCHDEAGVAAALAAGADACTFSPVWPTPSKPAAPALGPTRLRDAARRWPDRVVALGGVDAERAVALWGSGVPSVAAIRAAPEILGQLSTGSVA